MMTFDEWFDANYQRDFFIGMGSVRELVYVSARSAWDTAIEEYKKELRKSLQPVTNK